MEKKNSAFNSIKEEDEDNDNVTSRKSEGNSNLNQSSDPSIAKNEENNEIDNKDNKKLFSNPAIKKQDNSNKKIKNNSSTDNPQIISSNIQIDVKKSNEEIVDSRNRMEEIWNENVMKVSTKKEEEAFFDIPEFIRKPSVPMKQNNAPEPVPNLAEIHGEKKEYAYERLYQNHKELSDQTGIIKVLLYISLSLSLVLLIIVSIFYHFISLSNFRIIIIAAIFYACFTIFGILAYHFNKKKIDKIMADKEDPEVIEQSTERMNIYFHLFLLEFSFAGMLIIGTSSAAFNHSSKFEINAIGYDKEDWKDNFGDNSFDFVMKLANWAIGIIATLAFLLSGFSMYIFIKVVRKVKTYRTYKLFYQFTFVVFFCINYVLIFLSFRCMKLQNVSKIENTARGWFASPLFGISMFFVIFSLIGIFAVITERKRLLLIIMITAAASGIALLVMVVEGFLLVKNFKGYKEADCRPIYKYLDEDFIKKNFHCDKYYSVNSLPDGFKCPKNKVVPAWELYENQLLSGESSSPKYGCISQQCCLYAYNHIKDSYSYTLLFAIASFAVCIVIIVCGIIFYISIESSFDEGIRNAYIYIVMGAISGITVIVVTYYIITLYGKPDSSFLSKIKIKELSQVSDTFISAGLLVAMGGEDLSKAVTAELNNQLEEVVGYKIINLNVEEDNEQSGKRDMKSTLGKNIFDSYEIEITIEDGYFTINDTNHKEIKEIIYHNESELIFIGTENVVTNFSDYITFNPYNSSQNIYRTYRGSYSLTGIIGNSSNSKNGKVIHDFSNYINITDMTIILDFTDDNIPTVNRIPLIENKNLGLTTKNKGKQLTFQGKLSYPSQGEITVDFTNTEISNDPILSSKLPSQSTTFEIGGIPYPAGNVIILYNVSMYYTNRKYNFYNTSFKVGGTFFDAIIPKEKDISIPTFMIENFLEETPVRNITGKILMGNRQTENLDSVIIHIFQGNLFVEPDQMISNILSSSKKRYVSNSTGQYFFALPQGDYTAIFENSGYYYETLHFAVNNSDYNKDIIQELPTVFLVKKGGQYELKVVLSWIDKPKDLDLHCVFKYKVNLFCDVSFLDDKCLGVYHFDDNVFGGGLGTEEIAFEKFSTFRYLFYVSKYYDDSNGISKEDYVDGAKFDKEEVYQYFNPISEDNYSYMLSKAEATLNIFLSGYSIKSFKISMDSNKGDSSSKYWVGFCLDGSKGMDSFRVVNEYTNTTPSYTICEEIYKDMYGY